MDQDPSMLVAFRWEDRGEGETRETQSGGREEGLEGREGATETKKEAGDSGKREGGEPDPGRKCEASEGEGRRETEATPEVGEGTAGAICAPAALQAIGCPSKDS